MDKMLIFSPNLYLGEGIKSKKLDKIKKNLIHKPLFAGVYIITLARNSSDQLEIMDARQLVQGYYDKYPLKVVGIAKDYDDALKLIEQLTQECLHERGDCNLREYLIC
jgi:hypothetical protein